MTDMRFRRWYAVLAVTIVCIAGCSKSGVDSTARAKNERSGQHTENVVHVELGKGVIGELLSGSVEIPNDSSSVLTYMGASKSCSCTSVDVEPKHLAVASSAKVSLSLRLPEVTGKSLNSVRLAFRDESGNSLVKQLILKADAEPWVDVCPSHLNFGEVEPGQEYVRTILLKDCLPGVIDVKTSPGITASFDNDARAVTVILKPDSERNTGTRSGYLRLKNESFAKGTIAIPVAYTTRPGIVVKPSRLIGTGINADGIVSGTFEIKVTDGITEELRIEHSFSDSAVSFTSTVTSSDTIMVKYRRNLIAGRNHWTGEWNIKHGTQRVKLPDVGIVSFDNSDS